MITVVKMVETITGTFGRVAKKIRKYLYPVFKTTRHRKRTVENGRKPEACMNSLNTDLPQESLGDEVCCEALECSLEATAPSERSRLENKLQLKLSTVDFSDNSPRPELASDGLLQDGIESAPPLFVFASVRKPESVKIYPVPAFPSFNRFCELPFELRLKIWHLTMQPRLVHWNVRGAKRSHLKIDRKLPVILQVCKESRLEGLRLFDININVTCPIFFNPRVDTLLWTRYPNCPKTVDGDAKRLLRHPFLKKVRHIAILLKYWNKLLSHEGPKELYTALRKAPNLEILTLVDDYFVRRRENSQLTYGRVLRLADMRPEENDVRAVRWEMELRMEGKERLWKRWDVNLTSSEVVPSWKFPEIRFVRAVLEMP